MDDFFDNLRQTLSETAEAVGKKTEELVETQKLRSRIRTAQRNVDQDYRKLGHMVFQRFVEGEALDQELSSICDDILEVQAQIARYQEALAKKRGQDICPACGKPNPSGASFCMFCGAELPAQEDDGPHFEEEEQDTARWKEGSGDSGMTDPEAARQDQETAGAESSAASEETGAEESTEQEKAEPEKEEMEKTETAEEERK